MRNEMKNPLTMDTNQTVGLFLLVTGISVIAVIYFISKINGDRNGERETKPFDMPHEQPNKSFIEKGLTDGMSMIPNESFSPVEKVSSDVFFENDTIKDTPPP